MTTALEALNEAIKLAGGMPKLGRALVSKDHPSGITKAAVFDIRKRIQDGRDDGVHPSYAMIIEELTGIKSELLSPGSRWHVITGRGKKAKK